ncbi:MAG: hypothetical protein WCI20_11795, partial [bacterium]
DIGDGRARKPLLDVLLRSRDAKVVSASSEALARLGEMAAVYEIIPRMKAATNPVLKSSLAIAVGDLLGKPGEFYQVMVREKREPGSEIERLLKQVIETVEEAQGDMKTPGRVLQDKAIQIREQALAGRLRESVVGLFELAVGLAALRYGIKFGRDSEAFVETMIWNDARFGLSAWCLELLQEPDEKSGKVESNPIEVLLGVYLLSRWKTRTDKVDDANAMKRSD